MHALLNCVSRSGLERPAIKGDSPVREAQKEILHREYGSSDMESEDGPNQGPTLNTTQVR